MKNERKGERRTHKFIDATKMKRKKVRERVK